MYSVETVGCVLEVDRDRLCVLDQHGSRKMIKPSQISNLISERRKAVATDRNGSEIHVGDKVREVGGEQKQGDIKHIFRSYLFLHNRAQADNSGISVVRANNVATIAARGGRVGQGMSNGIDTTRMNPALQRNGTNGHIRSMAPPSATDRWDRAIGYHIKVCRGPFKGRLGTVVRHRDQVAYVNLDGGYNAVDVPKDALRFARYPRSASHTK